MPRVPVQMNFFYDDKRVIFVASSLIIFFPVPLILLDCYDKLYKMNVVNVIILSQGYDQWSVLPRRRASSPNLCLEKCNLYSFYISHLHCSILIWANKVLQVWLILFLYYLEFGNDKYCNLQIHTTNQNFATSKEGNTF